jgi:hypothetical protein
MQYWQLGDIGKIRNLECNLADQQYDSGVRHRTWYHNLLTRDGKIKASLVRYLIRFHAMYSNAWPPQLHTVYSVSSGVKVRGAPYFLAMNLIYCQADRIRTKDVGHTVYDDL